MPFMDHTGQPLPQEGGDRHESRHAVTPKDLAVVLNSNIIAHPLDVSAYGLAVLVPSDVVLGNRVEVRLIVGASMRMAQGTMQLAGRIGETGSPGADRVGLQVMSPGPLATMLKGLVAVLADSEQAA